jgi:hypothetical protein
MGMAPGRGLVLAYTIGMIMKCVILMAVTVMRVTVCVRMSVMIVRRGMMRMRHGRTDWGHRPAQRTRGRDQRAPLYPQQAQADGDNQPIADDLDDVDGRFHRRRRGPQQHRRDPDENHGDQRLQQRRGERQHHTAAPGFLVRHDVGGDHRLAMAWTGGMEDTVEKRHAQQAPHCAAVLLAGADQCGKLLIERILLGDKPANEAARRDRRRLHTRRAEWRALRQRSVDNSWRQQNNGDDGECQKKGRAAGTRVHHRHFTWIL